MTPLRQTGSAVWALACAGLLSYAFLYDNATSLPSTLGYGWTKLTDMSRQVRLVEIGVVAAALLAALSHGVSALSRGLLTSLMVFVALGLVAFQRGADTPVLDGVRLIYMWVLPFVVFIIGRESPAGSRGWRLTAGVVLLWVSASAVASWVQFAGLRYPVGDDITGFNKDAHANGTLLMFAAQAVLAHALFFNRRAWLVPALALLVTMVLSSVLKVLFLAGVSASVLLAIYLRRSSVEVRGAGVRRLIWGAVAGVTVAVVSSAFVQFDAISSERMQDLVERVREDPQSLAPIQAHRAALARVMTDLPTLTTGAGLFRYANPISVGQVMAEGTLGNMAAGDLLALNDETGEQARVTLSASLIAEFGLVAAGLVALMFGGVLTAVWRATFDPRIEVRARASGALANLVLLGLVPFASLFGSFDIMSVSWPVLLLAGQVCRQASEPAAASPASEMPS